MKFKKKKQKETSEISTASLPDIVFMLLFFFMVSTVMRTNDMPSSITIPTAVNPDKIKVENDLRIFLTGQSPIVNIEGQNLAMNGAEDYLKEKTLHLSDYEKSQLDILLYIDENTKMKQIHELKVALRKNKLFKINYMGVPQVQS